MCTVCLLPFISNPVPRVLRTGGLWGRAAANKGTKAPRHRTDTVLVRSLAGGISWCEGTALISAAEVWHSSPLPPQRRDIQTLPASCPGVERDQKQLRGGDTKLFLWCIRRRVCSQSTQLMWRFHDRPQMIQGNAAMPCLLQ